MKEFYSRGVEIQQSAKALVVDYLKHHPDTHPSGNGVRQSIIFKECGFDWGSYPKATSSNQQFWVIAILKDLEKAGSIEQIKQGGPWRRRKRI